jgi:Ca2+-binding EF-hand superfamily protein
MRPLFQSRKTQLVTSLLCLIAFSSPAFSLQENGVKQGDAPPSPGLKDIAPSKPEDAVTAFIEFFTVIDRDSDGKVTLAELFDAHNAEEAGAKTLTRIKAWDTNKDGMISRTEGGAGVKAYVLEQVQEQFKADGDGDGVLSLNEFALAVHDPNGEKLPGGDITRRQETMFRSADADRDNRYNRAEAIASLSRRSQYGYVGRRVAYRARIFDLDQDRRYDLKEFALIYGVKPGEPIPQAVLDKHKSKSFGAGNHTYYNVMMRLIHATQAELQDIDAHITAYGKHQANAETAERVKTEHKQ